MRAKSERLAAPQVLAENFHALEQNRPSQSNRAFLVPSPSPCPTHPPYTPSRGRFRVRFFV